MPRSTIKNCARTVLKPDTLIQKDAVTALSKGSSVFISYLTTHANEIAISKKRKTIMPNDVFEALKVIEFSRFVPDLKAAHEVAEKEVKEKRDRKKSGNLDPEGLLQEDAAEDEEVDSVLPPAKKPRMGDPMEKNDVEAIDEDVGEEQDEGNEEEEGDDDDQEQSEVDGEEESEEEEEEEDDDEEEREGQDNEDSLARADSLGDDLQNRQIDTYDEALDNGEDSD